MPKSKHRKGHSEKLNTYKANKKKEQELFKKKMIDQYMKMQQEMLENQEAHSSVEEVSGPEINLGELNADDSNVINEFEPINLEGIITEDLSEVSNTVEILEDDNNNQQ